MFFWQFSLQMWWLCHILLTFNNSSVLSFILRLLRGLCCLLSKLTVSVLHTTTNVTVCSCDLYLHLSLFHRWHLWRPSSSIHRWCGEFHLSLCDQNMSLVEHAVSDMYVFLLTVSSGGTTLCCTMQMTVELIAMVFAPFNRSLVSCYCAIYDGQFVSQLHQVITCDCVAHIIWELLVE